MALHDPDSTAQEKAMALKIGRQKKIQVIDGQRVEVMTEGSDEEEEMEGVAMQGEDGQHYVVLEVIQLPDDGNGNSPGVVQLPGPSTEDFSSQNIAILPSILEEGGMADMHQLGAEMQPPVVNQEQLRIKKEQERATCFGFDSDDEV